MNTSAKEQAKIAIGAINDAFAALPPFSKTQVSLRFEYPGLAPTIIPVILLKGETDWPRMWIQAAIHGDEYDGAIACHRMAQELDLHELNGSLIMMPLTNPSAFFAYQHGSPYDGNINLNRVFCENDNASYSWEYGRWLFEIISAQANFFIDFHGASKLNTIARYTGIANLGNPCDLLSYDICRRTGCDYILLDSNQQKGNNRGRSTVALSRLGIPAIVFENGGGLSWTDEAVENHIWSAKQVMFEASYLKHGEHAPISGQPFYADDYIYFETNGLLLDYVPIGTKVNQGDVCLRVMNVETMEVQEIRSHKNDCFVFCIHNAAVVKKGDLAFCLARSAEGLNRGEGAPC